MANKKLTESEIHELALIYAHAKLSKGLSDGTIPESGLLSKQIEEIKYLYTVYTTATESLVGIEKYE